MTLVKLSEILKETREKKYAVGAFGAMDLLSMQTVIRAAEDKNVPVILLGSQIIFRRQRDSELFFTAMRAMTEAAKVPVSYILDHGNGFEACMKAIRYGFPSVMFDGSSFPMEENIRLTKKIVEAAHAADVSVEGEIGHVGGLEGNISQEGSMADVDQYTKPEDAERFVEETGVDALAVAIGSVHGVYRGIPRLDLERLDAIRKRVGELPLVLHGGSGLPEEEFKNAIKHGISKINIYTSMVLTAANAVKQEILEKQENRINFTQMIQTGSNAMKEVVKEHMEIFSTKSLQI